MTKHRWMQTRTDVPPPGAFFPAVLVALFCSSAIWPYFGLTFPAWEHSLCWLPTLCTATSPGCAIHSMPMSSGDSGSNVVLDRIAAVAETGELAAWEALKVQRKRPNSRSCIGAAVDAHYDMATLRSTKCRKPTITRCCRRCHGHIF